MKLLTSLPLLLVFFSLNVSALNGHLDFNKSITDVSWNFLPKTNSSFKYSDTSDKEIFIYHDDFAFKVNVSNFNLDLERSIQPKKLKLNAESQSFELFFRDDLGTSSYSLSFKQQKADPQAIECYDFSSLVIGSCPEANLKITNNKPKYADLDGSLLVIDGKNQGLKLKFTHLSNMLILDEYSIFIEVTENKFNWISPLEEITSGFIGNLNWDGRRIGDLVTETINLLPQRDKWYTSIIGLTFNKSFKISKNFSFFVEPTVIIVKQVDYNNVNNLSNSNWRLKSGINLNAFDLDLSFYGAFYYRNLYGFEHISFNQRSEHHFDNNYGLLGISLKYSF